MLNREPSPNRLPSNTLSKHMECIFLIFSIAKISPYSKREEICKVLMSCARHKDWDYTKVFVFGLEIQREFNFLTKPPMRSIITNTNCTCFRLTETTDHCLLPTFSWYQYPLIKPHSKRALIFESCCKCFNPLSIIVRVA